jgi:hypothetical protein
MIDRCIFAGGVLAVMAAFAIRGNTLVIEHAFGEAGCVMTRPTILRGRYMVS